jgi:uracil-DNA glycosylase family 4
MGLIRVNDGFFSLEESVIVRGDEVIKHKSSKSIKATCAQCGLYSSCKSPRMKPTGEGRLKILIVGEAPGRTEDARNTQFVGESGELLRDILDELGYSLDTAFWKTNAVVCRPPNNEEPNSIQIAACRRRLMDCVEKTQPKVIIPLGAVAMESLVGSRMTGRLSGLTMTDWAGAQIPDQVLNCWVCPTWHPSAALRSKDNVLKNQIGNHIKKAILLKSQPISAIDYFSKINLINNIKDATSFVRGIRENKRVVAFDYETTGKKPHRAGHEIVSVSVSDGECSWAFPFFKDEYFREEWKRFLLADSCKKVVHNAKFETLWSEVLLDCSPKNIVWDIMLGAHIEHNQKRVNLKYLTYTQMGISGYDDEVEPYLETLPQEKRLYGANGFNSIKRFPIEKLLIYNGYDSLFTYLVWLKQINSLSDRNKEALEFFTKASFELVEAEKNGIQLDVSVAKNLMDNLEDRLIKLEKRINSMDELRNWNKPNLFRPGAPEDIKYLLYNILKLKPKMFTEKGNISVDKNMLDEINIPIVKKVKEWRRWDKVRGTYLKGFLRESVDGVIHPFFNLSLVSTYRSSSSNPNFQNVPKRDFQVMSLLRKILRPRIGHRLAEYDYKAIEAGIIACYNKDPNWIKYFSDPTTDMHKDMAAKLFIRDYSKFTEDEKPLLKAERQNAKSSFVFPTVYGSFYENTAKNLWAAAEPETIKHLKSKGIKNKYDFIVHVEEIEKWFWHDMFPVGYEWMKKTLRDYETCGYIDMFTGFRCYGPMSRNEVINYRVQGSAFHCLLWTFMNVSKKITQKKLDSYLVGQIHDAIIPDINPEEESLLDFLVWNYGTQKIREHWPWIIIPLSIEKSRSEIRIGDKGSWAEMEDCGLLKGVV